VGYLVFQSTADSEVGRHMRPCSGQCPKSKFQSTADSEVGRHANSPAAR